MMKTLVEECKHDWDLKLPYMVWCFRTTPRVWLGGHSPYECLFGLRPRFPFQEMFSTIEKTPIAVSDWMSNLNEVIREIHGSIRNARCASHDRTLAKFLREKGPTKELKVGDFVLLVR